MAPKTVEKLTDAEKKKIKQANKAKANPGKAEMKAETNLKRRIARGQIVDPKIAAESKSTVVDNDKENSCLITTKPKIKQTDAEKAEKRKLKLIQIEKELQEKQRQAQKERFEQNLTPECETNDDQNNLTPECEAETN